VVDRNLTMLEAVALAVRSEIDSTDLYGDLAKKVRNAAVRDMLEDLAHDEETHRVGLMKFYQKLLEGQEPSIPERDGRAKFMELGDEPDYLGLVTAARDKELDSEAFYKEASEKVLDYKTRMFFLDLAESERKHAAVLQKQVEKLQEDPHWFDREDDDPFKPMHVGP
jgi:rubrerythrin